MNTQAWWGDYSIDTDHHICFSIGERKIIIERLAKEWRLWNLDITTEENSSIQVSYDTIDVSELDLKKLSRYLEQDTSEKLRILPALPDRSIVARPHAPLQILPDEKIHLFVSTPVWFTATTLPKEKKISDIPFYRPSDSWFGPNNMIGEICYAKYTEAQLELKALERRCHRAFTPIRIHNTGSDNLHIERFNLPVQYLRLYSDSDRQLWTDQISISADSTSETAEIEMDKKAPPEISTALMVNSPRVEAEKRALVRAISSLFA